MAKRDEVIKEAARLSCTWDLFTTEQDLIDFCMATDDDVFETLTPEDLSKQYVEYINFVPSL